MFWLAPLLSSQEWKPTTHILELLHRVIPIWIVVDTFWRGIQETSLFEHIEAKLRGGGGGSLHSERRSGHSFSQARATLFYPFQKVSRVYLLLGEMRKPRRRRRQTYHSGLVVSWGS
jgi:hypothetical protein